MENWLITLLVVYIFGVMLGFVGLLSTYIWERKVYRRSGRSFVPYVNRFGLVWRPLSWPLRLAYGLLVKPRDTYEQMKAIMKITFIKQFQEPDVYSSS